MGKIRHIAYRAEDVEAFADFFVQGLGMEIVQRRTGGVIDLSDGVLNISVLPIVTPSSEGEPKYGIAHIGFTVEDEDEAKRLLTAAGGRELRTVRTDSANYEVKFEGPERIIIDLGHWAGTAPIEEGQAVSQRTGSGKEDR
jgi:catechol 2,3-dioxygenase-like lactoylglutathione lyase family enzyme